MDAAGDPAWRSGRTAPSTTPTSCSAGSAPQRHRGQRVPRRRADLGRAEHGPFLQSGNYFNDKEWIAAGPNGKVVVTWTEFNQGPHGAGYRESPIVGAISKDKGQTWNSQGFPISDAAHPFDQGSQVAFGPDGTLYVAYEATDASHRAMPPTSWPRPLDRRRETSPTSTRPGLRRPGLLPDLQRPPDADRRALPAELVPVVELDPSHRRIAVAWADNQGAGNCGTGGTSFSGTTSNQVKLVSGTWGSFGAARR